MTDDVLGGLAWNPKKRSPLSQRKRKAREALAGGLTRTEAAEASGLGYATVCRIAREMGIPKGRTGRPKAPERDAQIAADVAKGTHTLAEIGERWDLSRERVRQIAKAAGVHERKGITSEYRDHVLALAGTMTDVEVGRRVGCTGSCARALRHQAGIPRFEYRAEWHDLLGTIPDMEIVRRFGVLQNAVCRYRNIRGIPPWRERRRINWDAACEIAGVVGERWLEVLLDAGASRSTTDTYGSRRMRERGWIPVRLGRGRGHNRIIGWRREVDDE